MSITSRRTFTVPAKSEVSETNQAIFDNLQNAIGFVPNLYAYLAKNETALGDALTLQNRKSTLHGKEREVINLVTSQANNCQYCLSAHSALSQSLGFSNEQILEIRSGKASFDNRLDVLAKLTASVVENRGKADQEVVENFFDAGYSEANLIDMVIIIGDKIMSNFLHNITKLPVDFPLAPALK